MISSGSPVNRPQSTGRGSENIVPFVVAHQPGVEQAGAVHMPEVVGAGRRSTDIPCFTWINTVLGNVKTSLAGTYHGFNFRKYAHRYLDECQYRFNRRFDLKAILSRLVRAAVATGPRTEVWLRLAEHSC